MILRCCLLVASVAFFVAAPQSSRAADWNWPRWRGPQQDGHTAETGLPKKWGDDSVTWKTPLKGVGQSSPVIWGERIFLTAARKKGRERVVLCIDRNDGRILWEKVAWTGDPEPVHRMNTHASASCVTDGKRVYAFFGRGGGLFCYTVGGTRVWNRPLGKFAGPWGTAACPVLYGDLVIQNCDADEDAAIAAFNKTTGKQVWRAYSTGPDEDLLGKQVWRTKRDDFRGWSTPILIKAGDREELVVNGHTGARAYNPKTGKELWFCKGYKGRGTPTVTPSKSGLLHVVDGRPGDTYAIVPGGNGDVSETHRKWQSKRIGGRDLPSPVAIGDFLLISSLRGGVVTCYDTKSGTIHWTQRLGGQISATPIAYEGLAAFLNESGETYLIKPGPKPNVVARNRLTGKAREEFRASITPSDGQLFFRSTSTLYCIGKRKSANK
ncbi:MAG: PQQ-binding-like beta-propeller repeat protein [Planctomycetaceae bacterium]